MVLDWSEAAGASLYVVTATGDLGYTTSFQTDETTAEVELPCGQLFTFHVKAQDDRCDSAESPPESFKSGMCLNYIFVSCDEQYRKFINEQYTFSSGPCVPEHVQSFTQCEDSVGSVSWAPSDGAESYMAIAVGQDGHTHMCTTNTSSCTWDDLHCGDEYTIHVIANDYLCSSMPSNSTSIRMGK